MPIINSKTFSVSNQENIHQDILNYLRDDAKH